MLNPYPRQQGVGGGEGVESLPAEDREGGVGVDSAAVSAVSTGTTAASETGDDNGTGLRGCGGGQDEGSDAAEEQDQEQEEETSDPDHDQGLPPYLRGPPDPSRMELTEEEREWALEVKDAIQGLPDLDSLSDFMIAQIALVEWESRSLEAAVENAYNLQHYRQEYQILDTFNEGRHCAPFYIQRHPGYVLHFGQMEGRYAVVHDMTGFDIDVFREIDGKKKMMRSAYYFHHAFNPDLAAIREGVLFTMECEGFLWKAPGMVNSEVWRIGWEEATGNYPYHLHQFRFCNAGVIVNTMASMIRRYIPDRIHKKFQLGHTTEERLDRICLVPNLEIATDRIVREVTESLRRRYEAESNFSLE